MSGYGDGYGSESAHTRHGRSGRGVDDETYEPTGFNTSNIAARDGYAPSDSYGNPAYAAAQPVYAKTSTSYADDQYDAEEGRPRQRYLEYDRRSERGYGPDPRSRSHDDPRRSRYGEEEDDDDDDDYEYERRMERRRTQKSRDGGESSRSKSRGSRRERGGGSEDEGEDGDGNTQVKKWGATIAGAALGAAAAHKAKQGRDGQDGNWVPTAVGAFLGGFVAREAEKGIYKKMHEKKEDKRQEEGYRSRSR
jgi:hypothetical protein